MRTNRRLLKPFSYVVEIERIGCFILLIMSEKSDLKVWSRFQSRKDGSHIKFRIQDVPMDRIDDVLDFIMIHLLRDETFHKAADIINSEEAKSEFREICNTYFAMQPPHITICCVDDGSDTVGEILGISILILAKNTDRLDDFIEHIQVKTKEIERFFYAAKVLLDYTGSKNDYATFYEGRGVVVRPDYRKLGIANEFIRLRKQICIDHDVPMTCAWMTSIGTQKACDKSNWKTFAEISVEQLQKETGLTYDNNVPTFKLMYITKDEDN